MSTRDWVCDRPTGCVCGGDTPGVRAGCHFFVRQIASKAEPVRVVPEGDTLTRVIWREKMNAVHQYSREIDAQTLIDFPIGTTVEWTHTYKGPNRDQPVRRTGVVQENRWGTLRVHTKNSTANHRVEPWLADVVSKP